MLAHIGMCQHHVDDGGREEDGGGPRVRQGFENRPWLGGVLQPVCAAVSEQCHGVDAGSVRQRRHHKVDRRFTDR